MNVGFNNALTGNALGLLGGFLETLGLKRFKGFVYVAFGFNQSIAAVHNAGAAFFT
jgi:hypothetical protein